MAKRGRGHPTRLTPDVEERILAALRIGCTRSAAAAAAGISMDLLSKWVVGDNPAFAGFRERVEIAEGEAETLFTRVLTKAATSHHEGEWKAAAMWLERRRSRDWARTEKRTIDGKASVPATPAPPVILVVTQPGDTLDDIKQRVDAMKKDK